jgi:hypothetical protein
MPTARARETSPVSHRYLDVLRLDRLQLGVDKSYRSDIIILSTEGLAEREENYGRVRATERRIKND